MAKRPTNEELADLTRRVTWVRAYRAELYAIIRASERSIALLKELENLDTGAIDTFQATIATTRNQVEIAGSWLLQNEERLYRWTKMISDNR
jgi:hypothetical protein